MNALGMLRNRLVNDTTRTMNAFIAEAEERLGEPRGGQQGRLRQEILSPGISSTRGKARDSGLLWVPGLQQP
jgi:hypothetical protein